MGIYDRDYMRQAEREPADTPGMIARKGIILAVCIVVGLLFFSSVIRRNAAAREREVRRQIIEEEQLRSQLQWAARVIRETPGLDSEIKSDPPPLLRRLLNANTATLEELDEVPNVSLRMAESIIENRPYKSMEDLDRAWGIGKPTIERLRFYLTVE
jgi:hypothetical protein